MMTSIKRFLGDNKTCVFVVGLFLTWAVWVTNGVYEGRAEAREAKAERTSICAVLEDIRFNVREMNSKIIDLILSLRQEVRKINNVEKGRVKE